MVAGKYRVGIDVGGTNTDCAILDLSEDHARGQSVVAWSKARTTSNVTDGIAAALGEVLQKSQLDPSSISFISIGTTHFINAVVEADSRKLAKVAVIRLGAPYTAQCPPFLDWPESLKKIIYGHYALLDGGLQIDGQEIRPIRPEQLIEECNVIKSLGITNIVIVGIFSSIAAEGSQEEYAREIMVDHLGGGYNIICSGHVGNVGLLERENAAIINAAILPFARKTVKAYRRVLKGLGVACPLFLTQLDGTLIEAPKAAEVPVKTFANGPTNSMRGASFLSESDERRGNESVIVVDVGGTTTDVGVLLPSGFPRKAAAFTEVGGIRTNFSMPDVYSIGLGGGSRVRFTEDNKVTIGPDSVGSAIESEAIVFGGSVLTATDIAVLAGLAPDIGNADLVQGKLSEEKISLAIAELTRMLESVIDKMKIHAGDVTVLLVGGGSIIVPPRLKGVKEVVRIPHFGVGNAVGAAIGRVSGEVDKVEIMTGRSYDDVLEGCKGEARARAVASGAKEGTVNIAEVYTNQLPYVSNQATRIIVKAVGDLDTEAIVDRAEDVPEDADGDADEEQFEGQPYVQAQSGNPDATRAVNIHEYRPKVTDKGEWILDETDLAWISEGCAILGCGGGGAPYPAFLMVRQLLREGHRVRIVDESFFENDEDVVVPVGFMGSPSVSSERIPSGVEIPTASRLLLKYAGVEKVGAVISDEIGGKNGIEPMALASSKHFDCPLLDGDLMGRAYPRMNQVIPCVYSDNGLVPAAGADGVGNCVIIPNTISSPMVETLFRSICTDLGSAIGVAMAPFTVQSFREWGLSRSVSMAWRIGRGVAECRVRRELDKIDEAILKVQRGKCLFKGKIVDVKREVRGGFTWGTLTIAPLLLSEQESLPATTNTNTPIANATGANNDVEYNENTRLIIPFQNENLQAILHTTPVSSTRTGIRSLIKEVKHTLCTVPDLIAVLDSQSGSAIGTQDYRYGLRVTVIAMAGNPKWTTERGLEVGGPKAFGIDVAYQPIAQFEEVRSVIEEYRPQRVPL
ncbi:putative Hydantoinase/oxoprolinase [Sistotremastrum suecicum HHB10207 ss-3]|uniref:Putative Hydantoinase/oxoprolinase n=1 Tax=Sistotremastrum suecicum HHB10207 ss-3 TaxID=1314776 RepID=A0A166DJN7_9AGAM|nr:putative Hydantoinase/oxoprolinase [Sistotremastrum suecicum HHB10207 ss-3]